MVVLVVWLALQGETPVATLIERLARGELVERASATQGLRRRGPVVLPQLQAALKESRDAEVTARLKELLEDLTVPVLELAKELAFERGWAAGGAAWGKNGSLVVAGGPAPDVRVYDTASWEFRKVSVPLITGWVASVDVNADGDTLAIASEHCVQLIQLSDPDDVVRWDYPDVRSVRFGSGDDMFMVHTNAAGETQVRTITPSTQRASGLGGKITRHVAVASRRGLLAVATGQRVDLQAIGEGKHPDPVPLPSSGGKQALGSGGVAEFSPNERLLAVGGLDGTIAVYDMETMRPLRTWMPHGAGAPVRFAFAHDSRVLITSGNDGCLRLWHHSDWSRAAGSIACDWTPASLRACRRTGLVVASGAGGFALRVYRLRAP